MRPVTTTRPPTGPRPPGVARDPLRPRRSPRRSAIERAVAWMLFVLLVGAAAVSIVLDLAEQSEGTAESSGTAQGNAGASGGSSSGSSAVQDSGAAQDDGPPSFTIAATGDLLIHEAVADAARAGDVWDFTPMFAEVAPIIGAADLAVCHLETPLSPNNASLHYFPAFLVPRELAEAIATAGYDTCSLASNHATDAGRQGVVGTVAALDRAGVDHAGMALSEAARGEVTLMDVKGTTVAHLSYTYGFNNGDLAAEDAYLSNVIDEAVILDEASRARQAGAEFVILSMHWGTNYMTSPDDLQTDLGPRLLGSADIDLILGHHAHVVQPVDRLDDEYLAYGLGNFLSNQAPESCAACDVNTQDGVILHLTVAQDTDSGRWLVTELSHDPTWVDRSSYVIVPTLRSEQRDAATLSESTARTAAALSSLGTEVPTR